MRESDKVMDISWIVLFAVVCFFLAIVFDLPLESQKLAQEVTKDLVIGYLGYLTHAVKEYTSGVKRK